MTGAVECRYHGRDVMPGEMALLRALIAGPPCPVAGVLPARRLAQARRRAQGHDGPGHHAGHAQGWPDHPAAAEVAAEPARAHRLRAGHRTAAVPGADNARRGAPARPAHRRARHPRGQAVERVRRPPSLSRLQDPGRRPDALRRPRPRRRAHRHARLLHRRLEARPARQLHRMDAATAREEPPAGGQQSEVPHPALDRNPQPRLAPPRHRPPPPARGLDRALQHKAGADRDVRRDAALHRRRLQGLRLGPCRNHSGTRAL